MPSRSVDELLELVLVADAIVGGLCEGGFGVVPPVGRAIAMGITVCERTVWLLNLEACRRIASSVSSSRIRRRAARSSADSVVVGPGISPRSIRSCRIHLANVTGWMPRSWASCLCCVPARASATARARNSAGHGRGMASASRTGCHLATQTGTLLMGQVKLSPIRAADPRSCEKTGPTERVGHLLGPR